MENEIAPLGHNNPPSDEELLREHLLEVTTKGRGRYDELLLAVSRMPKECTTEEEAGKFADMVKLLKACEKDFESTRVNQKEPYLKLERAVDGFFKAYTEKLGNAAKLAKAPIDAYLKRKADEERRQREETARQAREEATRLEQEAQAQAAASMPAMAEETLTEAAIQDEVAAKAEKAAEAKPAELSRTRSGYGSVASLRTTWVGEITDRDKLDKAALWNLIPTDVLQKAVNAYVKMGGRSLAGANIFEKSEAQIR